MVSKPHESPGVGGRDARRDKDGTSALNERWTISIGFLWDFYSIPMILYGISND